jgi:DUF4097 and DUF4098 domain-containing protein YvlB
MRRVLIVVVLIIGAAVLGLWRSQGGVRQELNRAVGSANEDSQGEVRDEIRKSFELQPGARVEVQGINGSVDVQTSDTKTAEVYVLRTAGSRDALSRREVTVEQTANGLLIKGTQARHTGIWEHLFGGRGANEQVTIKAPLKIALALKGVNGRVTSCDIEGPVEVKGVNGKVELGQTVGSVEISGTNGRISVGLKSLDDRGVRVSGVNGGVELRLANGLNADLTAKGMNGNVRSEIAEVTVDKDEFGRNYSARIGTGGPPITISGVNGNVRLTRADTTASSSTSSDKKPPTTSDQKEKSSAVSKSTRSSGQ